MSSDGTTMDVGGERPAPPWRTPALPPQPSGGAPEDAAALAAMQAERYRLEDLLRGQLDESPVRRAAVAVARLASHAERLIADVDRRRPAGFLLVRAGARGRLDLAQVGSDNRLAASMLGVEAVLRLRDLAAFTNAMADDVQPLFEGGALAGELLDAVRTHAQELIDIVEEMAAVRVERSDFVAAAEAAGGPLMDDVFNDLVGPFDAHLAGLVAPYRLHLARLCASVGRLLAA